MIKFKIFAIVIISGYMVLAQSPPVEWTKVYGGGGIETGYSIQQTQDNGYIIAGTTYSFGAGSADMWLLKTDVNGDTIWSNTIGGSGGDLAQAVMQTVDLGYIVTGVTSSLGAGLEDIWLVKTDNNGDTLWSKTFGNYNYDGGYAVQPTVDGGYLTLGRIWSLTNSRYDVWLNKTDSLGNEISTLTFGGFNDDIGNDIQPTGDGNFIITGTINNPGDGNDIMIAKANINGDTLWTKTFGGNGSEGGNSVQQTSDNGFIITGFTNSYGNGANDIWLVKTDSLGNIQWDKTYGGASNENGFCVKQTSDDGYIIAGVTNSYGAGGTDIWLLKTDSVGDTVWERTMGGSASDYAYSVLQSSDGGYIIAGEMSSDLALIKIGPELTSIETIQNTLPAKLIMHQNYPNPFNPETTINYSLHKSGFVNLTIYDITGQKVAMLVNEHQKSNSYSYKFNANDLAAGVYYYTIKIENKFSDTKKMLLLE